MEYGEKLESLRALGVDAFLDRIENGEFVKQIARSMGLSSRTIRDWIKQEGAWDRYLESRTIAAEAYDIKAEQVLTDAKTKEDISRARELAHHYRWRSAAINPGTYGSRQTIDLNTTVDDMTDEQVDAKIAALQAKLTEGVKL